MSVYQIQGYEVFADDKPAVIPGSMVWNNNFFRNFEEAKDYASEWLGDFNCLLPKDWQGDVFDWGYGTIEIRFRDGITIG